MGDGYRYRHVETGEVQSHPFHHQLAINVKRYRRANNFPITTNWEEEFDDNVCRNSPGCPCVNADSAIQKAIDMAKHFAQSMLIWGRAGFPIARDEVIAKRRAVCEGRDGLPRCPEWSNSTSYFGFGRCGKCGCYGGLKTAVATEKCPLGKWER